MNLVLFLLIEKIRRQWFAMEDSLFDKKYGIKTNHKKLEDELPPFELQRQVKGGHSAGYQACWVRNDREAIRESLRILPTATAYIDVGSGLGKTLFVASEFPQFRNIIGLEFLQELHYLAIANILKDKQKKIILVKGDASKYTVGLQPTVIFLFNPFDQIVLREFINNNIDRIQRTQSVIAYVNDLHQNELSRAGFQNVYSNSARKLSIWQLAHPPKIKLP